jgi:ADP-ribose pyrophosphatase YjhB (NUDIX family)
MIKDKVFAYVTHANRLLVFTHPYAPEAGVQVPSGTLREEEGAADGVMREAAEETGLDCLIRGPQLGTVLFEVPSRGEVHRRHFFHLICAETPPDTWRHTEMDPDDLDGSEGLPVFEFFWAPLPAGVPQLAPGHDAMVPALLEMLER